MHEAYVKSAPAKIPGPIESITSFGELHRKNPNALSYLKISQSSPPPHRQLCHYRHQQGPPDHVPDRHVRRFRCGRCRRQCRRSIDTTTAAAAHQSRPEALQQGVRQRSWRPAAARDCRTAAAVCAGQRHSQRVRHARP